MQTKEFYMEESSRPLRFCNLCFRNLPEADFDSRLIWDVPSLLGGVARTGDCKMCLSIKPWRVRASTLQKDAPIFYPIRGRDLYELWIEQDGRCAYCKVLLVELDFHIDHITPRADGGDDFLDNIVIACETCNLTKGRKSLGDWKPDLSKVPSDEEVIKIYEQRIEDQVCNLVLNSKKSMVEINQTAEKLRQKLNRLKKRIELDMS